MKVQWFILWVLVSIASDLSPEAIGHEKSKATSPTTAEFPSELVDFVPYQQEPIFDGTGHLG